MSVCKYLPNGTTLLKWKIDGFDERYRAATCGDRWCSDLFTTNLEGRSECCLIFYPPVEETAYSKKHPFLDSLENVYDHVGLLFVDGGPHVELIAWMEDEKEEIVVPKGTHSVYFRLNLPF